MSSFFRAKAAAMLFVLLAVSMAVTPLAVFSDGGADLSVTVSAEPFIVAAAPLVLTIKIHNAGPDTAMQPFVRGTLPQGYVFDGTGTQGCIGSAFALDFVCPGTQSPLEPGMDYTFTVTATPINTLPCGASVAVAPVRVEAGEGETDPDNTNNVTPITVFSIVCPISQALQADLSLRMSAPPTLDQGALLALMLTVHNAGPQPATQTVVRGTLPAGYAFAGIMSSHCEGFALSQDFVCFSLPTALGANEDLTYKVYATPIMPQPCGSVVVISAANVLPSVSEADPDITNNFSNRQSVIITCPLSPSADVSIALTGSASVVPGGTMTYTLTAANNGPGAASNMRAILPVPLGFTFQNGMSSPACAQNGANIECVTTSLQSDASAVSTVVFKALDSLECATSIAAGASVTAMEPDPNDSNNQSALVTTAIICSASSTSSSASSSNSSAPSEPVGSSSSSSSSARTIDDINPNFNPPAPSTNTNATSHRGHDTTVLTQIARFMIGSKAVAPPAFGGGVMTFIDISADQKHTICNMSKTLTYNSSDRMPAQTMISFLLALQLGLPQPLVISALQNAAFCS